MLLTDVQPNDSNVLHLSISTKTYWWRQMLSNGGNLFVYLSDLILTLWVIDLFEQLADGASPIDSQNVLKKES